MTMATVNSEQSAENMEYVRRLLKQMMFPSLDYDQPVGVLPLTCLAVNRHLRLV
jgi:hypothetical protein